MKRFDSEDTIIALSTPRGKGALAVVRMSGERSPELLNQLFSKQINEKDHRKAVSGEIWTAGGERMIDECVVTYIRGPHSYTGEDLVEISCHGNPVIIEQIIQEIVNLGARVAQPGEFTQRAFLNQKMDLSQAEAVAAVIEAKTRRGLACSLRQLEGGLSSKIGLIRDELMQLASLLEVDLDFNEGDIQVYDSTDVKKRAGILLQDIDHLLHTYDYGRLYQEGLKLLLLGKPNVGKSSLLNVLVDKDRALVSEIPGTTRDYIEEFTQIEGFPIQIVDTAGIRETLDMIEEMGVKRALTHIESSDLILAIFDIHRQLDQDDQRFIEYLKRNVKGKVPFIVVLNKQDLGRNEHILEQLHDLETSLIEVSAKKGTNIDRLKTRITNSLLGDAASEEEDIVITNARHKEALILGRNALQSFIDGIESGVDEAILASELRSALDFLGEIIGEVSSEDLLNHIFARFCIGK
jgi:tRNA modification GTPase